MRFRLYTDLGPSVEPKATADGSEMANVVIYLDSIGAAKVASRRTITQRDEAFEPHVVAVERGASLDFRNADPFFHNVFSLSGPKTFDLGRFPRGQSKTVRFDRPGVVKVFCHIHADMSAVVLVLDSPFFVSPDASGQFELNGVPPGDYRIVAWHERAKAVVGRVHVVAGQAASIDFNIPVPRNGEAN
jgi:plastocyanin